MPIPDFTSRGVLPKGIHVSSPKEFVDKFCTDELSEYRFNYIPIIDNLLGYCHERGASAIFFTGSFITNKENPSDLDCIVVFESEKAIPTHNESFLADHGQIDITYCSRENESVLKNLLGLYSIDHYDLEVGIVLVELSQEYDFQWPFYDDVNMEELMIYRQAYHHRHIIKTKKANGLIVALHGIMSDAEWLLKLAPIASSNNWIYAPFYYGKKYPQILVSDSQKMEMLSEFREFIKNVSDKYDMKPNIIAHSFGTYIVGNYLHSFNFEPPVKLNNIIFAGSILSTDFPWKQCVANGCVKSIYNEVTSNDPWVPHIDKTSWLKKDPLFGPAGTEGFTDVHDRIINNYGSAFNHSNMLKDDIFEKVWIPHFNITKNIDKFDNMDYIGSFTKDIETNT